MKMRFITSITILLLVMFVAAGAVYCQDDDSSRQILKQGLLGAGTGAIAAGASGGKAGQGALIGAGTGIIGSALLDALTGPPASSRRAAPPPQDYYYADQPEEYYQEPPQESTSQKVLKQGLVGAGTGALAAGMSGGKAGQGALIGAGTTVVGNALLDMLTTPPQQRTGRVYRRIQPPPPQQAPMQMQQQNTHVQEEQTVEGGKKKIVKHYDASGKLVSEEEIYY